MTAPSRPLIYGHQRRPPRQSPLGPRTAAAALILGSVVVARPAAAQDTTKTSGTTGPAPTTPARPDVRFGGIVQTQLNTASGDTATNPRLFLRRVRLSATVRLNDVVSGRIQPEFAGDRVELNEAFVTFALDPALQIVAGRGGRPFGLIDATTAPIILPVERGAVFRGRRALDLYRLLEAVAYAGQSTGLQVVGQPTRAPLGLAYAGGYFTGSLGEDAGDADVQQFAGRVSIAPRPHLRLALGLSSRAFAAPPLGDSTVDPRPEFGGRPRRRGNAFVVDAEYGGFGETGLHAVVEYSAGALDPFSGARYRGAQGWLGYRTTPRGPHVSGVEPLVRISYGAADGVLRPFGGVLGTVGANVYTGGLNRIMLNYDRWRSREGAGEGSAKLQFQLGF